MHQEQDKKRKLAALYALALNYGKEFPRPLAQLWMRLLEPYSAEQVEEGVARVVSEYEYKFLPPFAVLRKAMDKASGRIPAEQLLDMQAEAEWNALLDALTRCGRYDPPALHATTAYVLRGMGGWNAACDWQTEKLEWRHKEFVEAWKLAHGNTHAMELGAAGVASIAARQDGCISSRDLVNNVLGSIASEFGHCIEAREANA